jgi:hypothetical protein
MDEQRDSHSTTGSAKHGIIRGPVVIECGCQLLTVQLVFGFINFSQVRQWRLLRGRFEQRLAQRQRAARHYGRPAVQGRVFKKRVSEAIMQQALVACDSVAVVVTT